ncbi:MAG: PTS sugar transporter subunit IIA, partial [Leptotrichiaceae bacterium]
ELGTTGIGKNVALPHAKTEGVTDLLIGIGVSKNGINYNSIDEEDAKIFFMFLSPSGETQEYLKILARISRLIRENDFRTKIINAKTTSELLDVIEKAEK